MLHLASCVPSVTSVSPNDGPISGGTKVTVSGNAFGGATAVAFGRAGLPACSAGQTQSCFTADSDTQITAYSPPKSPLDQCTVDVTVTTSGGTSGTSNADQFSYCAVTGGPPTFCQDHPNDATCQGPPSCPPLCPPPNLLPSVTSVTPSGGPSSGGTQVTISGSGFAGATGVAFGGQSLSPCNSGQTRSCFAAGSDSQLTAYSPPGSPVSGQNVVDVTVTNTAGTSQKTSADQFTYSLAGIDCPPLCGPPPNGSGGQPQPSGSGGPPNGGGPTCTPSITPPVGNLTTQAQQTIKIQGSCFGTQAAYNGDSPYILVSDTSQGWNAGCDGVGLCATGQGGQGCCRDNFTLNVTQWTNSEIDIAALSGASFQSGDQVTISVWNAQTGSGPATYSTSVSGP